MINVMVVGVLLVCFIYDRVLILINICFLYCLSHPLGVREARVHDMFVLFILIRQPSLSRVRVC